MRSYDGYLSKRHIQELCRFLDDEFCRIKDYLSAFSFLDPEEGPMCASEAYAFAVDFKHDITLLKERICNFYCSNQRKRRWDRGLSIAALILSTMSLLASMLK
jgi:hypothetical protein